MVARHPSRDPDLAPSLNPILDDRPPALLLREGNLPGVGPKALAAARQFAEVG